MSTAGSLLSLLEITKPSEILKMLVMENVRYVGRGRSAMHLLEQANDFLPVHALLARGDGCTAAHGSRASAICLRLGLRLGLAFETKSLPKEYLRVSQEKALPPSYGPPSSVAPRCAS
jgi:hypothetical protein